MGINGDVNQNVKPPVSSSAAITFADPAVGAPSVLFFMGANGMGKTTTVGKVASRLREDGGQRVLLAAADTFRWGVETAAFLYSKNILKKKLNKKKTRTRSSKVFFFFFSFFE